MASSNNSSCRLKARVLTLPIGDNKQVEDAARIVGLVDRKQREKLKRTVEDWGEPLDYHDIVDIANAIKNGLLVEGKLMTLIEGDATLATLLSKVTPLICWKVGLCYGSMLYFDMNDRLTAKRLKGGEYIYRSGTLHLDGNNWSIYSKSTIK